MKSIYDFDATFPNKQFKVGFIGTHSVGKTTLAQEVGKNLRVPLITEGVRHVCAAMGVPNISQVPDMVLFQWKVMQWQMAHEKSYDRFLTDRTTLDNAAYFHRYAESQVCVREYWAYMEAAKANTQQYTHLIYFPIMWEESSPDGFRDTDPEERKAVDRVVRDLIEQFGMTNKTYTIGCRSHEKRLVEVLSHLNLWQAMRELNLLPAQE